MSKEIDKLLAGADAPANSNTKGGGLIGTIISAAVTIGSLFANAGISRAAEVRNEHAVAQAREQEIEQWRRQNAYNSPTSQIARLKAAGINPALIYGNGIENTSSDSPALTSPFAAQKMKDIDPLTASQIQLNAAQAESISHQTKREDEKQPITLSSLNESVKNLEAQTNNLVELLNGIKSDNRKKAVEAYIAEETKDAAVDEIVSSAKITHQEAEYYVLSLMSEIGLRESQEELNRASTALTDEQRKSIGTYIGFAREYLKLAKEEQDWAREEFNAGKPWLQSNAQNQAAIIYRNAHIREKEDDLLHNYGDAQTCMELLRTMVGAGHDVVESYVEMNPRGRRYKRTINRGGQKTVVVQQ